MKTRFMKVVMALTMAMSMFVGAGGRTSAQAPAPDSHEKGSQGTQQVTHSQPYQNDDGVWMSPETGAGVLSRQAIKPLSTGGPDAFGYTWNDSIALSWIDATNGSIAGMSGYTSGLRTGPIGLPFTFKYYENNYTSLYIAGSGYLGFTDSGNWPWQPHIPSPAQPNNVIAPYATALSLASSGSANRVYYKSGGLAPNRYFVVEWYQVRFNDEVYTFEVILHENGDIVFQYQQMTYTSGWACGASGIEDATGTDGLAIIDYCDQMPSYKAVRFYRPAPSARMKLTPLTYGRFVHVAETVSLPLTIRNVGELGTDTYDLSVSSIWPATIFASDGITPLTDTDADGRIEIGSVPQSGSVNVIVSIQTPLLGNVGDSSFTILNPTSALGAPGTPAILQLAIPAPFTQVFIDVADYAESISLIQPGKEDVRKATANNNYGYNNAVAPKADGYVYMWDVYSYFGTSSQEHIEYAFLNKNGDVTRSQSMLVDNNTPPYQAYDYYPAVDVAPNGRIGVAWMRQLFNNSNGRSLFNIYFAVLNSSGGLATTPVNLTNNTTWGTSGDLNWPRFYQLHLAASGDNRFMISWERDHSASAGTVTDLYYLVRDTNGNSVKSLTKLTNDAAGWDQYYEAPTLTPLSNNRFFMAWSQYVSYTYSAAYAVFDSSGNITHAATPISLYAWRVDAVQLANGRILIAGGGWGGDYMAINYALLDGNSFAEIVSEIQLNNPFSSLGDGYVSVTSDDSGHGILTWMDYDYNYRKNLYYALVDGDGNTITDPMIMRTSNAIEPSIQTSFMGYGNTTNKLVAATSQNVDLQITAPAMAGGVQGGTASIPVWVANHGAAKATSIAFTATWDNDLGFIAADPAPDSVVGNVATWNLADLSFQGSGKITLTVSLPSTVIGTLYPITWNVTSTGPEANPADNSTLTNVMESIQIFLPVTRK